MTLVDGLRGLAALAVVFCHSVGLVAAADLPAGLWSWVWQIMYAGMHGVDVFFVLSGFVIAYSIGDRRIDGRFVGRFALRRSIRLDPPYWLAMVGGICIIGLTKALGNSPLPWPSPLCLVLHVFYMQGVCGQGNIVAVFWTLCLEVQLYLAFVLLLWASHGLASVVYSSDRREVVVKVVVGGTFLASLLWPLGVFGDHWLTPWFLYHWHKFLIGVIVCFAAMYRIPFRTAYAALTLLAVVALVRIFTVPAPGFGTTGGVWVGFATAVLLAIGARRRALYRWLNWPPLLWFGLVSYSLYLFHVPIITVLLGAQTRFGNGSIFWAAAYLLAAFGLSTLVASVVHRWIEAPSLLLARRLNTRSKHKEDGQQDSNSVVTGGIEGPMDTDTPAGRAGAVAT